MKTIFIMGHGVVSVQNRPEFAELHAARPLRSGQQGGAAQQPDMAVGLGVVTQRALGHRVVLLRQQTGGAGGLDQLIEEQLGLRSRTDEQIGLDQPGRAQMESAFASG